MITRIIKYCAVLIIIVMPAYATTYYVGSGADTEFGTDCSHATCGFTTIEAIVFEWDTNGNPSTGDDLYFKRGETFTFTSSNRNIPIRWSGSAGNYAIIGAYGSGNRPVVDGQWLYPGDRSPGALSTVGEDSCKNADGVIMTRCGTSILNANTRNYIRLENIEFINVVGEGPSFASSNNIIVENIRVDRTWKLQFRFSTGENLLLQNSELSRSAQIQKYKTDHEGKKINRGGGTVISAKASQVIVRYNYIHSNYGEGLDLIKGISNFQVYQNRTEDNRHSDIYVDQAGNGSITYNLSVRTRDSDTRAGDGSVKWPFIGVVSETEERPYETGNLLIMGNVMIGDAQSAIQLGSNNQLMPDYKNVRVINNTVIGAKHAIRITNVPDGSDWSGTIVSGNVFNYTVSPHLNITALNKAYNAGLRFLGNHWSTAGGAKQADIPQRSWGSLDKYDINPTVTTETAAHNFTAESAKIYHAALRNGTTAINSGINNSVHGTQLFQESSEDPKDAVFSTVNEWDFGAVDFGGTLDPKETLSAPTNLKIG